MVEYNLSDKITNSVSNVIRKQIFYEKLIEFKTLFVGFIVITSIIGFTSIFNGIYNNYIIFNIYKDIHIIKNINNELNTKINNLIKDKKINDEEKK